MPARQIGLLKLGAVGLDRTKIHANASRHSALSGERAGRIQAQLKARVAELMARAEAADEADIPDGMKLARAKVESRTKERFERERAEHQARLAEREVRAAARGRKPATGLPRPRSLERGTIRSI
jgi:hypothetical protein